MYLFFALFALLLVGYAIENRINRNCLSSFQAVIHVNGIRGKTSTCRYLDAALRARYRVFTKTTGTDAMMIDVSGKELPVRRFGPANLHEQLRVIRRARREGAQILILECMAVNPELQRAAQDMIVRSDITVITNVRYDHIFEMGETKEEIAASLAATIPENGTLFTADPVAADLLKEDCQRRNCRLISCPPSGTASENIGIARAVSASMGISEEEFQAGISNVKADFGSRHVYTLKNKDGGSFRFLNLFSVNDPESTRSNLESFRVPPNRLFFLYNHREDRPDRALLFAKYFFPYYKDCPVFLIGTGSALPKRLFIQAGAKKISVCRRISECLDLPEGALLVGLGNIKGPAYRFIEALEQSENEVTIHE